MKELKFATMDDVFECYTKGFKRYGSPWKHLYDVQVKAGKDGFFVYCYISDEDKHLIRFYNDFEVNSLDKEIEKLHVYRTNEWRQYCTQKYGKQYIDACSNYYAEKARAEMQSMLQHFLVSED